MPNSIVQKCLEKGLKMTEQRKLIAKIIVESKDHPDTEEVYRRAYAIDNTIGIATVYRTIRLFQENGIVEKHDFGDGKARYEESTEDHHDHIINIKTGEIIEFVNEEIEKLQEKIANDYGYNLVGHKLELYVVPKV
ncbi:MAG: Fur family transcriptional regulator [Rickettsiales bacterium]|nr:Fur family transcriptional regulator [Rickettsiales bacterium]